MNAKLARPQFGKESFFKKGINPNRNGWERFAQSNKCRCSEEVFSKKIHYFNFSKVEFMKGSRALVKLGISFFKKFITLIFQKEVEP